MKTCSKCKQSKELNFEFNRRAANKDGFNGTCRECQNKSKSYKHMRGYNLKKFWPGLSAQETIAKYNELFYSQNGQCAICKTHQTDLPKSMAVDHDHETGAVRGLLCYACNVGLGFFKDSSEILSNAQAYLNKPKLRIVKES